MPQTSIDVEYVVFYKCISVAEQHVEAAIGYAIATCAISLPDGRFTEPFTRSSADVGTGDGRYANTSNTATIFGIHHMINETRYSMFRYFIDIT
ncbi:hypothetical protein 9 [Diadegma semiclausum ichnovirus]|nr:hypothetical protein 9 [Diadegma semiclausum ichnovirus]